MQSRFIAFIAYIAARAAGLVALALAVVIEGTVTLEWSLPYCSDPQDGAVYAAAGLPLPYLRPSGASSMEFDFMPHVYALNLAVLMVCAYPLVRSALSSLQARRRFVGVGAGLGGVVVCMLAAAALVFPLWANALRPVLSIAGGGHGTYAEFRPVALRRSVGVWPCRPSSFWFPNGWRGHTAMAGSG